MHVFICFSVTRVSPAKQKAWVCRWLSHLDPVAAAMRMLRQVCMFALPANIDHQPLTFVTRWVLKPPSFSTQTVVFLPGFYRPASCWLLNGCWPFPTCFKTFSNILTTDIRSQHFGVDMGTIFHLPYYYRTLKSKIWYSNIQKYHSPCPPEWFMGYKTRTIFINIAQVFPQPQQFLQHFFVSATILSKIY